MISPNAPRLLTSLYRFHFKYVYSHQSFSFSFCLDVSIMILLLIDLLLMQLQQQYSPSEIYEARDEILKFQYNLNKIEALYSDLCSTLDQQQSFVETIDTSIEQTQSNVEKGGIDLYQVLKSRRKRDKRRCLIVVGLCTIGSFFLLLVVSVLVNVIQTFTFKSKDQNDDRRK